ncbi:MAG: tRNA-specific adenosine deaminase [candidate division WS6 bacterium OLB20]|uniref:tRNA-specific adenosine deaminase n=1 Tax=candidate division WS6 bacterium OLB20 TaxID=1617426 RepID=A0A136LVN9_9BACT|nr:MAG: tRNA-specific adenosine deaminase [candidate division WS6 bacterium OLB20]
MSAKRVRPDWDEYFMQILETVSHRATCDRGYSGSVIARDKQILSTGYVGAPAGLPHCDEVGHEMHEVIHPDGTRSKHCIRTTHAEQNAIVNAAKNGVAINGATIYCNMEPCYVCAKLIINAGIVRVVCNRRYHAAARTREVLAEAGVELTVLHDEEQEYDNKT